MPKPLFSPELFCSLKQCCFDFSNGSQCSNFLYWKEVETSFPVSACYQIVLAHMCVPVPMCRYSLYLSCCFQLEVAAEAMQGSILGPLRQEKGVLSYSLAMIDYVRANAGTGLMSINTLMGINIFQSVALSWSSMNFLALEPCILSHGLQKSQKSGFCPSDSWEDSGTLPTGNSDCKQLILSTDYICKIILKLSIVI